MDKPSQIELIKANKIKIEKYIQELPIIIESIFEQEKELSLTLMNITINEY